MEVRVDVIAENPVNGDQTQTNSAYVVYVALDEQRNPKSVPPLIAESELERERMKAGAERQKYRISQVRSG